MSLLLTIDFCKRNNNFVNFYNNYVKKRNKYSSLNDNDRKELAIMALSFPWNYSSCVFNLSTATAAYPISAWMTKYVQNGLETYETQYFEISITTLTILKDNIKTCINNITKIREIFPYDYTCDKLKDINYEIYLTEYERIYGVLNSISSTVLKHPEKYIMLYSKNEAE